MKLWPSRYSCNAFIIHDVDDRETITRELCAFLSEAQMKIWYSGKELTVGCNVHEEIMNGLAKSRYGIVILSRTSIRSPWLATELYELLARATNKRQKTVLPVLHGISMEELKKLIIVPDNIWAISSDRGIKYVAETLISEISAKPATFKEWVWENSHALKVWSSVMSLVFVACFVYIYYCSIRPPQSFIEYSIQSRINDFENKILREHELNKRKTKSVLMDVITPVYADFMNLKCYYRNEYECTNERQTIRSRKNVEAALGINLTALSPHNKYNFHNPEIYYTDSNNNKKIYSASFLLLNTKPVDFEIADSELVSEGRYEVEVNYKENLRYIHVNLFYPTAREVPKKHHVSIKGYLPREKYIFEKKGSEWKLKTVE